MTTRNASPEVCYVGYSALELAAQRAEQRQAMLEALAELDGLVVKWQARAAKDKREADRAALESAVTQMALSLASKGPIEPGRELPFMLTRRAVKAPSAPAKRLQSGVRRRTVSVYMSQVAAVMGV